MYAEATENASETVLRVFVKPRATSEGLRKNKPGRRWLPGFTMLSDAGPGGIRLAA
jgi:hypothetical protein